MRRTVPSCCLLTAAALWLGPDALPCALATQVEPRPVSVIVKTVDPVVLQGELVLLSLSDGAIIETDAKNARRIPMRDIVRVTTVGGGPTTTERTTTMTLAGGDILHGHVAGATGDTVLVETADLGRLEVPLDTIARLETTLAASAEYEDVIRSFSHIEDGYDDRVLLTNGDVLRGFVTGIDDEGLSIESEVGETRVPFRLVVAARLASPPPAPLQQPYVIVKLRSSGSLTATDLEWSGSAAEAELAFGPRVRTAARRIDSVEAIGGRWEWLARHEPISYEHTPMMSLDWHYRQNRNVLGRPMRVAGDMFEHGIGVHSRSSLTYDLQGKYSEFVTSFGLDDDSGSYADVAVFILVDGKRRFSKSHVRPGKLFGPVRLDVTRAKRIQLVVEFGDNGDLQDRFNWVETALIK